MLSKNNYPILHWNRSQGLQNTRRSETFRFIKMANRMRRIQERVGQREQLIRSSTRYQAKNINLAWVVGVIRVSALKLGLEITNSCPRHIAQLIYKEPSSPCQRCPNIVLRRPIFHSSLPFSKSNRNLIPIGISQSLISCIRLNYEHNFHKIE